MSELLAETIAAAGIGGHAAVINGRFLAKPPTGVTRVGKELLRAMLEELAERPDARIRIALPAGVNLPREGPLQSGPGWGTNLGEQLLLPLRYPDATIFSFCNSTPLLARRAVVWIHDSHVYDVGEAYSAAYRLWHKTIFTVARLRKFEIVAVSEFARQRHIALGADPAHVHTIHNGGDHLLREAIDESVLTRLGLRDARYVIVVGSRIRHKNIPFAAQAMARGLSDDVKIVVVGLHQAGRFAASDDLPDDPRIVRAPRITDGELRALYRHAACAVTPSLAEGFGLPAVEAMFEEAPLALSNSASLPEIGGDAALYFDATDADDIAAKVQAAMQPEMAAKLVERGRLQREKFRWRLAAQRALALMHTQA